jgi:hypothetical protein
MRCIWFGDLERDFLFDFCLCAVIPAQRRILYSVECVLCVQGPVLRAWSGDNRTVPTVPYGRLQTPLVRRGSEGGSEGPSQQGVIRLDQGVIHL